MSDFLFTTEPQSENALKKALERLGGSVHVYQGMWGTLAVTESKYPGFSPVETDEHVCVVIGGPVLYFQDNSFIAGDDRQAGTRAILERWQSGQADWSEDLSGPFVILVIDKATSQVECITDLMMFIPVYQYQSIGALFWGTHVDALAFASGNQGNFDEVSLVDFVLHKVVTYPYTAYKSIEQCCPASIHRFIKEGNQKGCLSSPEPYWQPSEKLLHTSLDAAADHLREGVQGYINRVTGSLDCVAFFISAGEDSRSVAGMLPQRLRRDAYIFLDYKNREEKIAKVIADKYGANFKPDYRNEYHYIDILPSASCLVGLGHEYFHSHTLVFDKRNNLSDYRAVFGGYISDSLLKGHHSPKNKFLSRFSVLPQLPRNGEGRILNVKNNLFPSEIIKEVGRRHAAHFDNVYKIRPSSAPEWFELWPATMRFGISNLYCNRRLFSSHEVFMSKESVKISATVPITWKLNRRLFNRAFKPALRASRFVRHSDGRLPYYPWWINFFIQAPFWLYRGLIRRAGLQKKNEGSWSDWQLIIDSHRWFEESEKYSAIVLPATIAQAIKSGALVNDSLPKMSKVNLMQVCFQTSKGFIKTCQRKNM